MTLGDALEWLDRHVDLERIERGAAGRYALPTLERIRALVAVMGDPQNDYRSIHVTGTNGKGSTSRIVAALLRAQGVSVGVMTSPHIALVNERIATDAGPIRDGDLEEVLDALRALEAFLAERDPGADPPSKFELITAAGLRYFSDVAVEAAVIEVGLGGRFDATNVVDGAVAIVTNVELDHVEIIGPDRASIAAEKAGIIKAGATAIIGETDPAIVEIFADQARDVGAELWMRGVDFDCVDARVAHGGRVLGVRTPSASYDDVFLPLHGAHQAENAACALAAVEAFFGFALDEDVVAEGLAAVTVPGRLEVVSRHPLVIVDGAHNPAGAASLGLALEEDFAVTDKVVLVLGLLHSHDPDDFLDALGRDRIGRIVATMPESPRATPADDLADVLEHSGYKVEAVDGVEDAIRRAEALAGPEGTVVITGSTYAIGAARRGRNVQ